MDKSMKHFGIANYIIFVNYVQLIIINFKLLIIVNKQFL